MFRLNLGIDFASGARIEVQSDHKLTTEQVEKDFESLGMDPDTVVLSGEKSNIGVARFVGVPDKETIAKVKRILKTNTDLIQMSAQFHRQSVRSWREMRCTQLL